ncbi:MAG: DivIVA domain-containing protein [Actinomycetota bacterium]|nr:DivIVA domain-containing protein [Actinomycetota bacterium]
MLAPQEIESVFLRPSSIASRRFTRSPNGYDPEEVHQFLEDVADYLSRLEGELEWRRARRTRERGTIGEQREAISVVTEAREHAERILADARKGAEGYIRLARAIAHQLALEAQARRPQVALAVTRASGSSTTVEGFEGFDDLEVWVDASVFDLTKLEQPEALEEIAATEAAAPDAAITEAAAAEVSLTDDPPQELAASAQTDNPRKTKKKSKKRSKKKF